MTQAQPKVYRGQRVYNDPSGTSVMVCYRDGSSVPLAWRLDLRNHSPTGLEWGYGGSGPAQLALAVLADAVGSEVALELYQQFKWQWAAGLKADTWEINEAQVRTWVERTRKEAQYDVKE